MVSTAAIYFRLIGSRIRSNSQYRVSFVLEIVGGVFVSFLDLITILVVFHQVPQLGRWSFAEVGFLFATSYLCFKAADLFVGHIDHLSRFIQEGSFDSFLIRPMSSLFQVLTQDFQLRHVGGMVQAIVVGTLAIRNLDVRWDASRIGMLGLMLLSGWLIFMSVWVATNCISFWVIGAREVANTFTYGGREFTMFPLNIFGKWLRRFLTYAVPLGFVSYFPALYILDKADPLGLPSYLRFSSPVVAAVSLLGARLVWRLAVRHYRSTGT